MSAKELPEDIRVEALAAAVEVCVTIIARAADICMNEYKQRKVEQPFARAAVAGACLRVACRYYNALGLNRELIEENIKVILNECAGN